MNQKKLFKVAKILTVLIICFVFLYACYSLIADPYDPYYCNVCSLAKKDIIIYGWNGTIILSSFLISLAIVVSLIFIFSISRHPKVSGITLIITGLFLLPSFQLTHAVCTCVCNDCGVKMTLAMEMHNWLLGQSPLLIIGILSIIDGILILYSTKRSKK